MPLFLLEGTQRVRDAVRIPVAYVGGALVQLGRPTVRYPDLPRQVDVEGHPKVGAPREEFAIGEIVKRREARFDECFFWATHSGAELDLLVARGSSRRGFERKHTSSPVASPSMRSALADLKLDSLDVVHAGERIFDLAPRVRAVALSRLLLDVPPL